MGLLKFLQLYAYAYVVALVLFKSAQSMVVIRFERAPPARSRLSTAVFRYSFLRPDGSNPCTKSHECSIYCELDGHTLRQCPFGSVMLKNLTVNHHHSFLLNVTTSAGERNSSSYNWFIDTIPPSATIISESSYTNAKRTAINITFSEACTGQGGFKCVNASFCDVMINGPAHVDASTLHTVEPDIKYTLIVAFSLNSTYGRVVIKMADNFCTDQAGNQFTRTNSSIVTVHFDRRPVEVDLWTSVPSYMLEIEKVPRTVLATNKMEDLEIFLDFSNPVVNSTKEILSVLHSNAGNLTPIQNKNHGNRRFVFRLSNVSRIDIITVEFQSASIIGLAGTTVSSVTPIAFIYDSTKPSVRLTTSSPRVTKETNFNVIVEFTKPVFGFQSSRIEIGGGRITRLKELSKALYLLTVIGESQNVVSVLVPEGKANDVSGNLNLASNQLEVRQYSPPAMSIALHSFVTAGLLATSLAAAVISISSTNLGAIGALTSGTTNIVSEPSMNLLGMVGHLQVFVLLDWIAVNPPTEYSETIKGLRWLIPHAKLPWKTENMSIWANYDSMYVVHQDKFSIGLRNLSTVLYYGKRAYSSIVLNSKYLQQNFPSPSKIVSEVRGLQGQHNLGVRNTPYGLPLDSNEYFIYFLREEPSSAFNVIKRMENHTGWQDFKMNLFWLGIGVGSLLVTQFLILILLRWRTGTSVHMALSVPSFDLFLLILMLPCISQSAAFIIRGGTTGGIIVGALLLAIPAALILSLCLFLLIAICTGDFAQYKEIKHISTHEPWHTKLLVFFTGRPTTGKWFYFEGLPSSFLPRFGFLFEDRKGPPVFVLANQNDLNSVPKSIDSGQSGIGRMRAVSLDDSNEETKIPRSKKLLGCARSAYLILDLLRRVSLGIISGAYSSRRPSQSIVALALTLLQFLYLFTLKPYIRRGVNVVESVSLLSEAAILGLTIYIDYSNPLKSMRIMGFAMLALLFITFVSQLVNEWYALIRFLLRLSQSRNPSFKIGLKCVMKGLILPFLPRKHWSRLIPGSSQPKTGLVFPVLPPSPETEMVRRDNAAPCVDPLSAMTATIVPILSPSSPGLTNVQAKGSTTAQTLSGRREREASRLKGIKLESKSDLQKLRKLARDSFSGTSKFEKGSSSYAQRERFGSDGAPSHDS